MDITTLLIIIIIVLLVGGGGWYGRGRWFQGGGAPRRALLANGSIPKTTFRQCVRLWCETNDSESIFADMAIKNVP